MQQALANQIGNVPLFANENYPISSLRPLLRSQSPVYNIPVTALNDFFSRYLEYNVKFIKIDTEGAELLVLLGLSNVISWFRPIIMYEESESSFNAFNYKAMDIITFFSLHKYSLFRVKERFNITYQERNFKFSNIIAVLNEDLCGIFNKTDVVTAFCTKIEDINFSE